MIAGLEEITSGTIRIGGEIVNDLPPRARNISMVFQSYALYPHMSVRENMGFSLKIAKRPQARDRRARGRGQRHPSSRRSPRPASPRSSPAASASASRWAGRSCASREVFLFDEPLSNLDAKLRAQMRTEIKLLHARVPSTVIYVTHDQVEAMTLADRIVIMRDGLIEQVGSPDDVFRRPATPVRRRLHRLADHESGRRRDRRRPHRLSRRRLAAGSRPVQERRRLSRPACRLRHAPGRRLSDRPRPAVRRGQPGRRARTSRLGDRAARQRDAGLRPLRRPRLDGAHAQSSRRSRRARRIGVSFDLAKAHLFSTEGGRAIAAAGG